MRFFAARREPAQTYGTGPGHPPTYRVHQLGDVSVVVDPGNREVVTVLLRTPRRWQHGTDERDTVKTGRETALA
jgi:hypothetical protein